METQLPVILSSQAMATRFELMLYGDDPVRLRAAGEEALQEIERLESQLSFYRAESEIRWINYYAADRPVKVEPRLFELLRCCADLTVRTEGAFDITIGPLMRAWRFFKEAGRVPEPAELGAARRVVGMHNVEFDEELLTIRFKQRGVEIDLGAYGKGYAIERAVGLLRENGITSALMHGGTSSIYAIGKPPKAEAWRIGLHELFIAADGPAEIELCDQALSLSAVHGKSFTERGRKYGHILDPRTGEPTSGGLAAVAVGDCPAVCEALSTALLVNGPSWLPVMVERFPGYEGLIAYETAASQIERLGSMDALSFLIRRSRID
jgi:thiamine biosynthesis lipoprotein